jgi:uncharacterized protein YcnI
MKTSTALLASVAFFAVATATAHVTVWPRESRPGAYEKYVVRVPTEGKVATASVELQIPQGVTIVSMGMAQDHTYELKRDAERIVAIVWRMAIPPGEFAEFAFVARNPATAGELVWKAVQRLTDGTNIEWSGPAEDKRPASVTKLAGPSASHSH